MSRDCPPEPPKNIEAERLLLSEMVTDPGCIPDVMAIVVTDDFATDAHQKLFDAITTLAIAAKPIDFVTTFEQIRQRGHQLDVPASLIGDLYGLVPNGANAVHHAELIRDASTRRRVIHAAMEAIRDAHDDGVGADVLSSLESRLTAIANRAAASGVGHIGPHVQAEIDRLAMLGTEAAVIGIPTGIPGLDAMTGGWHPGLYTIGARPSVGKTALMLTAALEAVSTGHPALCISLEMPPSQLVRRHVAMMSGVNLARLRENRPLSDDERQRLDKVVEPLKEFPLYVNESMSMSMRQIRAMVVQCIRRSGVRLVFIDYLQLIQPDDRRANRVEQLETISRGLKTLSAEFQIPVIALAQLNRVAAEDESKKPSLSHFRGSGSIEQDSDDCYLLWRPSADSESESDLLTIGLDVAKQRNGPTGEIFMGLRRSCCRFEPIQTPARR
jgi:replicative DNA helicase